MSLIVTGTGTDVGKTMFSALVMKKYAKKHSLSYWKPIQTGSVDSIDYDTVKSLSGVSEQYMRKTIYSFQYPASPHYSAKLENTEIDTNHLLDTFRGYENENLLIELAGGLMVPINEKVLTIDFISQTNIPLVLVASSSLGTINHTLLSIEAILNRKIALSGFYFIGKPNPLLEDNARTITLFSGVPFLGSWFLPEDRNNFSNLSLSFDKNGEVEKLVSKVKL
jgi:dethiobiotin synthetase